MASKIVITFGVDAVIGDIIDLAVFYFPAPAVKTFKPEEFKAIRNQAGEVWTFPPTGNPGEQSAIRYGQAFALDYGLLGTLFTIAYTAVNEVTINAVEDPVGGCTLGFSDFSSTEASITAVITNCTPPAFNLVDTLFDEAVTPCDDVEISIETDVLAPEIWLNGVQIETVNAANPYIRDIARGIDHRFRLINAALDELHEPILSLPPYHLPSFSSASIIVQIIPSLSGATLIVTVDTVIGNPAIAFTFSLDDITYLPAGENTFTGQADGAGTMYAKDQWGCTKNIAYEVTAFGTRDPFLFISKANSINFVEDEAVDGCTIFENENNRLAHQGLEDIIFCTETLFQTCDTTTIQFKSNYDTPTVFLRHEDGSPDTSITVTKKTSNLNRFKSLDCWYYEYKVGLLGLYFTTGDTYDEFDIVNGSHALNGNLPDFAIVGEFVDIDGVGVREIVDVVFDSVKGKKAIIVEHTYVGIDVSTFVKSTFDLLPFEVWEFTIVWNTYGEGLYDVLIDNTDTTNGTVQHLSENIWIQDVHKKTLAIQYFNNNNRDIFYKFGIEHFIRIPYLHIEGVPLQESEINVTDLTSSVTDSSTHEMDRISFEEVVKGVMRKLVVALGCENLFVNGIGYIKNGSVEVENPLNTNLYLVTAELLKTNINYNNNRQGQEGLDDDSIPFDIPAFIGTGTENLKT